MAWRAGRTALVAAGLLALAACDEALSQDQIMRTLAGNSIEGKTADDETYWVYFTDKGDIFMLVENGFTDSGRWRATDDGKYCRTWRQVQAGIEACFGIKKSGRTLEFERDKTALSVKLIEGNPQQLPRRDMQRRAP
ncbi:MAG: hypothetical protein JNK11_06160 [Alphaproteobacteria bacterium]|nr:hypothetical protein [Alphaproteobacteria bacterium]